jgi:hypothetical protein
MMGRMNMGKQIATAPASRLPVVTQLDKTRAMATPMKKGGMVSQKLKKSGFYDKDKTKSERKKIVSQVTTKPQRLGMVEEIFSSKKMKAGGTVSSASKRADGCCIKGKTRA